MAQETRVRPEVETVPYARVRFEVARGPDLGLALERAGVTVRVGTADSADLRLHDDTVSREHCEVELSERGFRIRDVGSTNGVRVHGLRVYDVTCSEPLDVALGDSVVSIRPVGSSEPRERASAGRFGELLGQSSKMRELFAILARVALSELSVLIQGETGTGKELVARAIHASSKRSERAFVVFDCSAAAHNLIESDLFGHVRGAFTGASAARSGALEEADGGTLFLDELGELPLDLQQKLLRCLQEGEFRRVGSNQVQRTNLRVIAATNRDLAAELAAGRFREDLYYRLEEFTLRVPPLRERSEDIPLLVEHFVRQAGARAFALPEGALSMFQAHRWPGNVRELRNVVRRMVLLPDLPAQHHVPSATTLDRACALVRVAERVRGWIAADEAQLRADWLALEQARREVQDAFELDYLGILKRLAGGNKARAGAWAGVSRQAILKLVDKHGFEWRDPDDS